MDLQLTLSNYVGLSRKAGRPLERAAKYTSQMQEIGEDTLQRADKIVIDSHSGAMVEAGDLIIALEKGVIKPGDIYDEIGEIAAGKLAGRQSDDEITVFKSVGNAVQDASVARAISLLPTPLKQKIRRY